MQLPLVSVIIVNYQGIGFLQKCIDSVLSTNYPNFEVIVVDNGSSDGSYELLRSLQSSARIDVVRNEQNLGFAEGNNVGFKRSNGEIIVFLNADTQVEPDWMKELWDALTSDQEIAAAQCKLLSLRDRSKIDSVGWLSDPLGYVYRRRLSRGSCDCPDDLLYADGAAMAVKRAALNEVLLVGRPFDQEYFCYYEETDLCWRLRLRGFRIVLAPAATVYHHRAYVWGTLPYLMTFCYARNRFSTLLKNYDYANLLRWFPLAIFLELVWAATLLTRDHQTGLAKLRAILWVLRDFKSLWTRRLIVQRRIRLVPDSEILRCMTKPNFNFILRSLKNPDAL